MGDERVRRAVLVFAGRGAARCGADAPKPLAREGVPQLARARPRAGGALLGSASAGVVVLERRAAGRGEPEVQFAYDEAAGLEVGEHVEQLLGARKRMLVLALELVAQLALAR